MGQECTCTDPDQIRLDGMQKENQNSKFFYYSDPQLLTAFQDKLKGIQQNIEQQKQLKERQSIKDKRQSNHNDGGDGQWNQPSRVQRKQEPKRSPSPQLTQRSTQSTVFSVQAVNQLKQFESKLQRENQSVQQNLDIEKKSGWNEAIPQRLVIEVGQVSGLWNTSESWFTQCRSIVQVEFAGTCINSKPNRDVDNPKFDELFIFPVSSELSGSHKTKVFISVINVEGKQEVPDPSKYMEESEKSDHHDSRKNSNVYKRVAEYCLDIEELCKDQLVHELTISLPIPSKKPHAGPLCHQLRQCDISGFIDNQFSEEISDEEQLPLHGQKALGKSSRGDGGTGTLQPSPPIKKEWAPQRELLPVFTTPDHQPEPGAADFSILDIVSQIDEPLRLRNRNNTEQHEHKSPQKYDLQRRGSQIGLNPNTRNTPMKAKFSAQQNHENATGGTGDLEYYSSNGKKGHNRRNSNKAADLAPVMSLRTFEQNLQCMMSSGQKSTSRRQSNLIRNKLDSVEKFNGENNYGSAEKGLRTERYGKKGHKVEDSEGFSESVASSASKNCKNYTPKSHLRSPNQNKKHSYQQLSIDTRKKFYLTPNDIKGKKRGGMADDFKAAKQRADSPVKAIPWEDALGKPAQSFSFDEYFNLDGDQDLGAIDENWSPVAMGSAAITLENRVSPLKIQNDNRVSPLKIQKLTSQTSSQSKDNRLLGGIFPIVNHQHQRKKSGAGSILRPFAIQDNNGCINDNLLSSEKEHAPNGSDCIKVELRIQYLRNANEYLQNYKDKLHHANNVMRQMDLNKLQ